MGKFVGIYGSIMLLASLTAAVVAGFKRRDWSYWAAIAFLFPPAIVMLILMPKNTGPLRRRPSLDDEDRNQRDDF
jgi:hypothetical protein